MAVEYFPPGAPSNEAAKQEQSLAPTNALARQESRPPPPSMDGLVKVVITMADGTELELRNMRAISYDIVHEAPRHRVGGSGRMGYSRYDDGSTTARLNLTFDEVSYAVRSK